MYEINILFDDNNIDIPIFSKEYNNYLQKLYYNIANNIVIKLTKYYKIINIYFINSPKKKINNNITDFDITKYILDYNSNLSLYDCFCNMENKNEKIIIFSHRVNDETNILFKRIKKVHFINMDFINMDFINMDFSNIKNDKNTNSFSYIINSLDISKAKYYDSLIDYFVETQLFDILI